MEEEVVLLEEQLASAHTDIQQLQARLADLQAREEQHQGEVRDLKTQLDSQRSRVSELEDQRAAQAEELSRLEAAVAAAEVSGGEAVQRFREAALAREPELPADLVSGGSVAEVESSLEKARQTVARVRQHLDQQAQGLRVPAGSPVRQEPDLSDLPASEKIRLGLRKS